MIAHTARNAITRLAISAVFLTGVSGSALTQTAMAQTADDSAEQYSALLTEIANVKLLLAQKEAFVGYQEAKIASLEAQIAGTPDLKAGVQPMLDKMIVAIEAEMSADVPFKQGERFERFNKAAGVVADAAAVPAEKMRLALGLYSVEVGYGQSMEAYGGAHPIPDKAGKRMAACVEDAKSNACGLNKKQLNEIERGAPVDELTTPVMDGDYLRYGRVALVYMTHDASASFRYDPPSKKWEELSSAKTLEVRRAIRIAKGEAAPGVVTAPVFVAGE